ncbi:MAG: mechanosensitive ion channel, partial [Deltaproteobacteria bacterium]|nr:mechanosensitive ion channel [Deltaproteobacteria bacterium]
LKEDAASEMDPDPEQMKGPGAFLSRILRILSSEHDANEDQFGDLWAGVPRVLPDLYKVFIALCPYGTSQGALLNVLWVAFFLLIGLIVEIIFRKFFIEKYFVIAPDMDLPQMSNMDKFIATIARLIPELLGVIFFSGSAYTVFCLFIWTDSPYVQLFFLAALITISAIRVIAIISQIIFSPSVPSFRVLPMECKGAMIAHRLITGTTGYIVFVLMFAVVTRRLGAQVETVLLLQLFFASLLLAVTAGAIIVYKQIIHNRILAAADDENQSLSWGRKQFAAIWHIIALTYLFILWFLLLNDLANPDAKNSGAFILSFFVVPIWMVADRIVQWVVRYAMYTLKIHQEIYVDQAEPTEEELSQRQKGKDLFIKTKGLARIVVIGALLVWVASLWNITIPFFSNLATVMLDALIILTLALFFWQFVSSWIERKIQESTPEEEEDEDQDSEWGGAASRGRSYTLLPMIRKFIASVLVIMVTLTILSSMGVDIGPLLAGAGVVGLAIGFGAQKLVADMFSGFFYLLDDAFRVGEYLTAGNVSGTVESITLRNVMLRHHRGMLQIVPHSELGAITNFMRGGIIVKFNLDFPYDAPIDKIRKIIKKVGQKMLDSEEYGKDFIRPVKSQGVREITNSVMTIRVKFTAQPGTHFVIRREAYRLITEALNDQDIHYAHRKVIVDLPEPVASTTDGDNDAQKKQLTHAVGAAAQRVIEEEETAAEQQKPSVDDAMGG